jgi:Tricorn protease C1 domain
LHDEEGNQLSTVAPPLFAANINGCSISPGSNGFVGRAARSNGFGHIAGRVSIATFEEVWRTVRDRFYDPHLHGLDWSAVRKHYLPGATRASSEEALAGVINSMLSELHASHTRYYTPEGPEYYQLSDIFAGALRRRGLERAFPGGRISYPGVGVLSRVDMQGRSVIPACAGAISGRARHSMRDGTDTRYGASLRVRRRRPTASSRETSPSSRSFSIGSIATALAFYNVRDVDALGMI